MYILDARTLRVRAGKRVKDLAAQSGLDRGTVSKVEKGLPVSDASAWAIFNVLNSWHEQTLDKSIVSDRLEGNN